MESSPQYRDRLTTTPDAMPTTVIVVGIDGSRAPERRSSSSPKSNPRYGWLISPPLEDRGPLEATSARIGYLTGRDTAGPIGKN
jgi:hypothetical protein